jgi:Bifunctional DNA primase/polymerase, N-terminal
MLTAALGYSGRGWLVLPLHSIQTDGDCTCGKSDCTSPGKHPRTTNGLKDASTDADQINCWWRRWPDANVGIATGAGSGIVVIDLDGNEGGQNFLTLVHQHRCAIETLLSRTGGGGYHWFFSHPGRAIKKQYLEAWSEH